MFAVIVAVAVVDAKAPYLRALVSTTATAAKTSLLK